MMTPPKDLIDRDGRAVFGTYVGNLARVDLSRAARRLGRLYSIAHEKRWFYTAIATDELYVGAAIADLGYATNAFAYAASVGGGMLATTSIVGPPGAARVGDLPEEGADAWFRGLGGMLSLVRHRGSSTFDLSIDSDKLRVYATLDTKGAPLPITAVAQPDGGDVNVTQKHALLPVRGMAEINGKRVSLDGAQGGLDYTHGFLPRATAWRWAYFLGTSTDGHRVGLNLVEGWNGQPECAVWLDNEVLSVGEGRFHFDRERPLEPWSIETSDDAVNVTFRPVAMHAEKRNLMVIHSEFVQPIGTFHGTLRLPGHMPLTIDGAVGVVEDQRVRW
jgi:hypothetical protein